MAQYIVRNENLTLNDHQHNGPVVWTLCYDPGRGDTLIPWSAAQPYARLEEAITAAKDAGIDLYILPQCPSRLVSVPVGTLAFCGGRAGALRQVAPKAPVLGRGTSGDPIAVPARRAAAKGDLVVRRLDDGYGVALAEGTIAGVDTTDHEDRAITVIWAPEGPLEGAYESFAAEDLKWVGVLRGWAVE